MPLSASQIMECIENPTKARIVLYLQQKGKATAKQLLAANENIPQATLYRSLKSMEAAGIVEVAATTQVRAVTEKTYALTDQFANMENELLQSNDGEAYYRIFSGFALGLLRKFEQYATRGDIDIAGDGSSFNAYAIYATADELAGCAKQIGEILAPYAARRSGAQRLHTFAAIVTPPIEQEA